MPTSAVLLADSVCQLFSILPSMTLPWAGWRVEFFPGTRLSELAAMESLRIQKTGSRPGPGGGRTHPAVHPRKRPRSPREDQILSLSPDPTQAHVSCTPGSGSKGQEEQTGLEASGSSPPPGALSSATSRKGEAAGGQWSGEGRGNLACIDSFRVPDKCVSFSPC